MDGEAIFMKPGEITIANIRAALGDTFMNVSEAAVFVLGRPGELSTACAVRFGWLPSGRGEHKVLICPKCDFPKRTLLTDGKGGLSCIDCLGRRTRHQQEKHLKDYRRLGGRQEDRFLNQIIQARNLSASGLWSVWLLKRALIRGDQYRAAIVQHKITALISET